MDLCRWKHKWFRDGEFRFCRRCGLGQRNYGTIRFHWTATWTEYVRRVASERLRETRAKIRRKINLKMMNNTANRIGKTGMITEIIKHKLRRTKNES